MTTDNENLFLLFRDTNNRIDSLYNRLSSKLDDFELRYSERVDKVETDVADHSHRFRIINIVVSWLMGGVGISAVSAYLSGWFRPHN